MLKRVLAISLILLLWLSNVGFIVQKHYCCGKLKNESISLFSSLIGCCAASKMNNRDCCEDLAERLSEDHEFSQHASVLNIDLPTIILEFPITVKHFLVLEDRQFACPIYRPPPLISDLLLESSLLLI
jgi:hypothetical protein